MRDFEAIGLMFLGLLALYILQASGMAKESALVMRHQITKAQQEADSCKARKP